MKPVFTHLYVIPTNRFIGDCLKSYISEILQCSKPSNMLLVCVINDCDEIVNERNAEVVSELKDKYSTIRFINISNNARKSFVCELINNISIPESLLLGEQCNYGRIANITSLIGAYYNARYIHRRDSDTFLFTQKDEIVSPLSIEMKYLKCKNSSAEIVGGGYFLNPSRNLELFNNDVDKITKFITLTSLSLQKIKEYDHASEQKMLVPCLTKPDLLSSLMPEMGNISYGEIYKQIAFPSNNYELGADYFLNVTCCLLGYNVYYHNQSVLHIYRENRSIHDKLIKYYLGFYRNMDREIIYTNVYRRIADSTASNVNEKIIDALENGLKNFGKLHDERLRKTEHFIDIMRSVSNSLGNSIALEVEKRYLQIMDETIENTQNHLNLSRQWTKLINSALMIDFDLFKL